jgi:flagellar hook-basal body complex protein FliE
MKIYNANMVSGDQVTMRLTHPRHLPADAYTRPGGFTGQPGQTVINLEKITGAGAITRAGSFEEAMLQALDQVSAVDKAASGLAQRAIIEPDTVDIHDLTIAQAKAGMSLDITRNVLSRLVQGWRDIINTR